jgi:hypothetical protein
VRRPVFPFAEEEAEDRMSAPIRRQDGGSASPFPHPVNRGAPAKQFETASSTKSFDDSLSPEEQEKILIAARRLKRTGLDPAWNLKEAAIAEERVNSRLDSENRRTTQWDDWGEDYSLLVEILSENVFNPDALDSPSVRSHLKGLRLNRRERGCRKELFPSWLDKAAAAIALKGPRARPVRPGEEQTADRIEYGFYVRLRRAFAGRVGLPRPKTTSLDQLSLVEIVTPPGDSDLEPALARQCSVFQKGRGTVGALMPSQRTALALLELRKKRPVNDSDLDEALRLVRRLTTNLREMAKRQRVKSPT